MTDADIWTCREAIKRIAWLETREERQAALDEVPAHLRGIVERGIVQIFPVVKKKRAARRAAVSRGREATEKLNRGETSNEIG